MKIGRIRLAGNDRVALFEKNEIQIIDAQSVWDIINGNASINIVETLGQANTSFEWLSPIDRVEKVICIGRNYEEHAKETGADIPEIPVVFNKFPSAITAHQSAIRLPAISEQVFPFIGLRGTVNIQCIENLLLHVHGQTAAFAAFLNLLMRDESRRGNRYEIVILDILFSHDRIQRLRSDIHFNFFSHRFLFVIRDD